MFTTTISSRLGSKSRPLMSNMRLRKTGPIIFGLRVRDTISCVFVPHSVNSVRTNLGLQNLVTESCY